MLLLATLVTAVLELLRLFQARLLPTPEVVVVVVATETRAVQAAQVVAVKVARVLTTEQSVAERRTPVAAVVALDIFLHKTAVQAAQEWSSSKSQIPMLQPFHPV
jgi:hypothetical protein